MQEELQQIERNDIWNLLPHPESVNIIGNKWVYWNKTDEHRNITKNETKLVAQGYIQVKGIDFEETFATIDRLESIRLLLSIASTRGFALQQMDVKSTFLNGTLQEAYVE